MRKILIITLILAALFVNMAGAAYALTDAEHKKMLKDPDYAEADQELNKKWKEVTANLSKKAKDALLKDQRAWIKSGRDQAAKELSKESSRIEAYTVVTFQRADELEKLAVKYTVMSAADGHQGYYVRSEKLGKKTIETGWMALSWSDKKSQEMQANVDVIFYPNAPKTDYASTGEFDGKAKLSGDSLEIDDDDGGLMIVRFKNGGKSVEVVTNQKFKENGWAGNGVIFDGTYTLQALK